MAGTLPVTRFVRDEDGRFHFAARNDDMIVSAGYNIAGPEVEAALLAHPDVAECAVIGAADRARADRVGIYRAEGGRCGRQSARSRSCRITSRRPSRPTNTRALVKFIDALPKTQTGKIQRFKLSRASTMSKSAFEIVQPKHWAAPKGYANGVAAQGRQVFIAGQIGWNAQANSRATISSPRSSRRSRTSLRCSRLRVASHVISCG